MAEPVNAAASFASAPAGEGMMTDDQLFLLTVILGVYFGPHLKGETPPHKSTMEKIVERLPHYTPDQLAGSKMMVAQMMHIYYYILRKASQSVIMAPALLVKFFRNTLPAKVLGPGSNYPQFISLFPTNLHPFSYVEDRFLAIDSIIFIDNPSTSYLREAIVARFKSLTGLQEFALEKDATQLPIYLTDKAFYATVAREARSEGRSCSFVPPPRSHGRKRKNNEPLRVMPLRMGLYEAPHTSTSSFSSAEQDTYFKAQLEAQVVFSPLSTTEMQYRGSAAAWIAGTTVAGAGGLTGSTPGRVTLAESTDCYLFQVSLPGVRRDKTFSCELDMSGEVLIEGETATDGKVVERRTGNLRPSGHLSLCFQLPGRVDPRRSNCNFGSDGIFQAVVKKLISNQ